MACFGWRCRLVAEQNRAISASIVLMTCLWALTANGFSEDRPSKIDFTRDIRPILSNHCWSCHGPDAAAREAGLRLDDRESAVVPLESGSTAIVPGRPGASELISRIESKDDERVMPPRSIQKPLSQVQLQLLKQWIADGAKYSAHWAFQTPVRPELPKVANESWPRNEIDRFVIKSIEDAGLKPSPAADRATWLRRVTLDLTGLSPTPVEVEAFLADTSPEVEVRVVDRLLLSRRHAEHMARQWLDAARYADTNGYNNDETRSMWPWRDWLIEAFARGMPYDQFLIEQLAGDLLPDATLAQKVATGFNRNHVLTTEGGIIEEEYHVEYVADRVHTTSTVFLGLSMQCARCHDHKFDPITQREYYEFSAFFNNVPDKVVGYSQGRMAEPLLKVPSPEQQTEQTRLNARRDELTAHIRKRADEVQSDMTTWEQALAPEQKADAGPGGLAACFPLDETEGDFVADTVDRTRHGAIKGKTTHGPGRLGNAVEFDGSTYIDAGDVGRFESDQKFSLAAWILPASMDPSTVLSRMDEADAHRGYDVILEGGKVASHLVHHWPDRGFKVITKEPISLSEWHHVVVTYDGSKRASGVTIYVDGVSRPFDVTTDNTLEGTLHTDKPFHIGQRHASAAFKGKIDEVEIYSVALSADEAKQLASGASLARLAEVFAIAPENRTPVQRDRLRQHFLDQVDPATREWKAELARIPVELAELDKAIPVTMVMSESTPRRRTYILKRGQYDQHGDEVSAGVPAMLGGNRSAGVPDRLALARWLTHPSHPLTARVAVNRWWEMFFGTGLVETSEDFGVQGTPPTHPELLDWLARELVDGGWDQRAILKMIALSSTYRQSSHITSALLERDPKNRLLARGPRYRLPVETVRDNALAISGLLSERIGGESVKPYQPEGLWEDVSVERRDKYVPDSGEGLYRRSMYTFWKRTCPPPAMTVFDAPDRETCVIRRARTNTPLQALILLNDPTYVEAARKFAERVLGHSQDENQRLAYAYQLGLCRTPAEAEMVTLLEMIRDARKRFASDPASAEKLLSVGHSSRNTQLDTADLAAWTVVCSMLLNLDETISQR